ncbi:hypothetical protein DPSP01_010087 [Paraphaeosphaeria sporulosa]|uniref:DnaJ-domain-containing protein n=1 Tax=Paraphaeosphaeria sporulosa TaxID=1460663 RepID=A0A177CW92_9PLEO|nr:DnaJ-domain-containing protein [Paraphaeosphaeria sporulosa]OAG11162.1 DnaJ-domain-containing protein [Paraphaeosphaeria sporulosa]
MPESSYARKYYADLDLTPSATAAQIKAAYHRLALLYHPDKKGPGSNGDASEFRKAQEAYEKLYEAKVREENREAAQKKTADNNANADSRPFNIFNPRRRARPPTPEPARTTSIPTPTTKRPYTYNPNAKFHDVGSEMEEH